MVIYRSMMGFDTHSDDDDDVVVVVVVTVGRSEEKKGSRYFLEVWYGI